jgi:hypothetical protein
MHIIVYNILQYTMAKLHATHYNIYEYDCISNNKQIIKTIFLRIIFQIKLILNF